VLAAIKILLDTMQARAKTMQWRLHSETSQPTRASCTRTSRSSSVRVRYRTAFRIFKYINTLNHNKILSLEMTAVSRPRTRLWRDFGYVKQTEAARKKRVYRCSLCRGPGHRRSLCAYQSQEGGYWVSFCLYCAVDYSRYDIFDRRSSSGALIS